MCWPTYEFLDIIRVTETSRGILVSFDVVSLFTNVAVEDTMQIVIDNIYDHDELHQIYLQIYFETCY